MAEQPIEQIHPDALRAAADVVEALHELGFTCSLAYIEGADFSDGQHYLANIDAAGDWIENPDAVQRKLNQMDGSTSEHADELAISAPNGYDVSYLEEHDSNPVFWKIEAVIRIIEDQEQETGG